MQFRCMQATVDSPLAPSLRCGLRPKPIGDRHSAASRENIDETPYVEVDDPGHQGHLFEGHESAVLSRLDAFAEGTSVPARDDEDRSVPRVFLGFSRGFRSWRHLRQRRAGPGPGRTEWARRDSNPRHLPCKGDRAGRPRTAADRKPWSQRCGDAGERGRSRADAGNSREEPRPQFAALSSDAGSRGRLVRFPPAPCNQLERAHGSGDQDADQPDGNNALPAATSSIAAQRTRIWVRG
jgi:hypothetical protein